MQLVRKHEPRPQALAPLPPLEPSPRVFADEAADPTTPSPAHTAEQALAFVTAGPATLTLGGIASKLVDARLRLRGGAPVADRDALRALDRKIAGLQKKLDDARLIGDDADLQLQELHLRPNERIVWLAPLIGGDADVAAKGAVLRQTRNAAARDVKTLRPQLHKAHGERDALLASTLAGVPAFQAVTRKLDDARRLAKKLDDADEAAFRALAKIAPSLVAGEATHAGTTAETAGPMNLSQQQFLDFARLAADDLRRALEGFGVDAALSSPNTEKHERTGAELVTLRADIARIRAALAPQYARLADERRALLEHAAVKLR